MLFQLSCTSTSLFLNFFLIFLITKKSPKQLGNYKYLMVYTAFFEIFYTIFDVIADANIFSHGHAIVIFHVIDNLEKRAQRAWIVIIYCSIIGKSVALLGAHFVYRYGAIDRTFGQKVISGWRFPALIIIPLIFAIWWGGVVKTWLMYNQETDEESILEAFNLPIEQITYGCAKFYKIEKGVKVLNPPVWIAIANECFIVSISMLCVFGLGTLCYLKITRLLEPTAPNCKQTTNLQQQLFYTLTLQTIIPLFLLYFPILGFFLCPMFDYEVPWATKYLKFTVTLYPVIDPLPNFFLISSYRKAVKEMFICKPSPSLKPKATVTAIHML